MIKNLSARNGKIRHDTRRSWKRIETNYFVKIKVWKLWAKSFRIAGTVQIIFKIFRKFPA